MKAILELALELLREARELVEWLIERLGKAGAVLVLCILLILVALWRLPDIREAAPTEIADRLCFWCGDVEIVEAGPEAGASADEEGGDQSADVSQADQLLKEAMAAYWDDRYETSRRNFHQALVLYRNKGNRLGEASVLLGLGHLERLSGNHAEAREAYGEARVLFRQVGDRLGEANVLGGLGELERESGSHAEAREAYGEARVLFRQVGNRLGEANVLLGLGDLERLSGNHAEAREAYGEARVLFRQVGNRLGEANVLRGLGHLERLSGNDAEAREAYGDARVLFRQIDQDQYADEMQRAITELN